MNSLLALVAIVSVADEKLVFWARRDRELKFTAAGWKHDCHGRWYRDGNAELTSMKKIQIFILHDERADHVKSSAA
ncbi:hypothetical protein Nepgr_004549 [Nepenthes gracilis]|uniref:Uncharacterized protein n=1 Tax=Nepenthes gracilis TaxID=150966 RepID=A0AAD3S1M5_NEPGR|nr:hypothetical protein Nepgr_004549 [Nepenthes gracilis]